MQQIKNFIMAFRGHSPRVISIPKHNTVVTNIDRITVNTDFVKNTLYIGYESQMQNTLRFLNGITLFLIEDIDDFSIPNKNDNCIVVFPRDTDLDELTEKCASLISNQNLVFEDTYILLDAFLSQEKLQDIIEVAAQTINNPIAILDNSYKVIASSATCTTDDFQWNDIISRGYCSYEFITMFSNIEEIKNETKLNQPFFTGCLASPLRRCISRLTVGWNHMGYLLSIEANGRISERNLIFLQVLSRLLAKMIDAGNRAVGGKLYSDYGSVLLDCLNGNFSDRKTLLDCMKNTSFKLNSRYYILVIDIGLYNNTYDIRVDHLREHINQVFKGAISVSYMNDAVILFESGMTEKEMMEYLSKHRDYYAKNKLRIGFSDSFDDLFLSRKYHDQTIRILKLLAKLNPSECIVSYEDYKLYDLMLSGLKKYKMDIKGYISRECASIIEYDQQNDTRYFETLYYYIQFNRNLKCTADKLFIHKNTVSYRISRARELFNIDLEDAEVRLKFSYSYMLQELLKADLFD
ncbi:PucR family transcriptional regulator [Pelotomaculum propionicicum]|uniref:PucR family transcriptional regulator n=1 Tax=Pelotomaculum propionicicum TaxID=258475 RepID=UPI003B79C277